MTDNTTLPGTGDTVRDIDRSGIKTQVVQLDFGGAGAEALATLTNSLPVAQSATNFTFSANGINSSTSQLTAGASFTGTVESVVSQTAISLLLTIDQPAKLVVNQFIDAAGARLISAFSFVIAANVPFSQSFIANGNYCQVTLQNTGSSTTTTLNLNTSYGTMWPSTQLGNLDCAISEVGGVELASGGAIPVTLVSAGVQQVSDQTACLANLLRWQQVLILQGGTNGFTPIETPGFLIH